MLIIYDTNERKKIASHNSFSPSRKKVVLMSSEIFFNFLLAEFNFLIPSFINFSAFLKSFLWADLIDLEEIPLSL